MELWAKGVNEGAPSFIDSVQQCCSALSNIRLVVQIEADVGEVLFAQHQPNLHSKSSNIRLGSFQQVCGVICTKWFYL